MHASKFDRFHNCRKSLVHITTNAPCDSVLAMELTILEVEGTLAEQDLDLFVGVFCARHNPTPLTMLVRLGQHRRWKLCKSLCMFLTPFSSMGRDALTCALLVLDAFLAGSRGCLGFGCRWPP